MAHRVEPQRFAHDLKEAADNLQFVLQGIANSYERFKKPDPHFKGILSAHCNVIHRDILRALISIPGEVAALPGYKPEKRR
jgi:hypothetical protein